MNIFIERDINGNKVARLKFINTRGFSIQTNGNLPKTHSMSKDSFVHSTAEDEIHAYVKEYGTKSQKTKLGW